MLVGLPFEIGDRDIFVYHPYSPVGLLWVCKTWKEQGGFFINFKKLPWIAWKACAKSQLPGKYVWWAARFSLIDYRECDSWVLCLWIQTFCSPICSHRDFSSRMRWELFLLLIQNLDHSWVRVMLSKTLKSSNFRGVMMSSNSFLLILENHMTALIKCSWGNELNLFKALFGMAAVPQRATTEIRHLRSVPTGWSVKTIQCFFVSLRGYVLLSQCRFLVLLIPCLLHGIKLWLS